MRNVGFVSVGGTRYGYIHQSEENKKIRQKRAKLEMLGCTNIIIDIGDRVNLDSLLEKATFRDHIYFYDHSVFKTMDELFEMSQLSFGDDEGDLGVQFDIFDTNFYPLYSEDDTIYSRKRTIQQRRFDAIYEFVSKPFGRLKAN